MTLQLWLQVCMNRHSQDCTCPCCQSLARVFGILDYGCNNPGFFAVATAKIRALEADLRDSLSQGGLTGVGGRCLSTPLPFSLGCPGGAATLPVPLQGPPPPPGFYRNSKGELFSQPPAKAKESEKKGVEDSQSHPKEEAQVLKVKKLGAEAPERLSAEEVKEELDESPRVKEAGVKEANYLDREEKRKDRKERGSRHEDRSRSRKKQRKADKKSEDSSRRKAEKSHPKSSRGEEESPSREELQRRPRESAGSRGNRPQEPGHPPPDWERDQERKERDREPRKGGYRTGEKQGPGWFGKVPFSSHQRWYRGKNKGVVKRAKQERYNERRR